MSHTHADRCGASCPLADLRPAAVDRRAFLSQAVLATAYATAAAALAACGGGGDVTSPSSIGASINLADYPALATTGGVATVTLSGTPIAIVRTSATNFIALSRVCPHQGTTIDVVSGGFHCPNHGAQFDGTGRWEGGQRTSNLTAYATTYDAAAGTLHIG